MAECFQRENNRCVYASDCVLEDALGAATAAYLRVLDGVTLEKLVVKTSAGLDGGKSSQPVTFRARTPIAG
jgi:Rrf2 family nitric oxide-sensitive transcriptional repressor